MSKVYEALKKAQREGRWRDERDQTVAVERARRRLVVAAETEKVPESATEPTEIAEQSAAEERTPEVNSSLEPGDKRNQGLLNNGGRANDLYTDEDSHLFGAPISAKAGRRWRFWQAESDTQARGPRLIINQESFSRAAEQFQVLRANLESLALERDKRVILITSAWPGEGKSFVALNLAVALARAGSNVLLVDADLGSPSLHLPFNLVALSGLLPYLEGKAEFAESITATPEPRLGLIAAGGVTLSGPEALAGSRMRALIEYARQLQPPHMILLDAPATAAGAEAQILSKLVDGALLVVAANMTPRAAVTKALELIKGVPVLSAVLNRFEFSYSASRHIHYYGRYKSHARA
jgi:capsular exopolysaccharide synthesis family protein